MNLKKGIIWIMTALLLTGCAAEPVYETIGNVWDNPEPVASAASMEFSLPDGAEMEVLSEESGSKSYRVGNWELWTEVYPGGDVSATLEQVTGMDADALTVIQRQVGNMDCHETTWTTTDEEGVNVARAAVIDDGNYHYCISLMVPEEDAQEVGNFFEEILYSVNLVDTEQ